VAGEDDRTERRLAAILAADVAGYSRLMGQDEEGTLARLKAHRRELVDGKIKEHRGRIVKTTGDGLLAEFASVVDAVRCAAEIQSGMAERNAGVPAAQRIEFRIGLNVGDIIIDGGDIFGDGVNIAARLENLAEPGGICVSQVVRDQVQDKLSFAFADMGAQTVKNIARPVHAYRITTGAAARPPAPRARKIPVRFLAAACAVVVIALGVWLGKDEFLRASAPAQGLSIVVLPFSNLSGDTSQDYLADVITDELTTYLSRLPGSFVIARTTALTYKGRAIDAKQIGRDLGVSYLLEGGVQPSGNRVRIDAQLIDTKTGANLWVEKFDNERGNLLQMQDEIVFRLARALHSELNNVEVARLHRTQGNPDSETMAMQCEAALLRYGAASS
jgi:class 3 adenylate cyclase/TolB-like protein